MGDGLLGEEQPLGDLGVVQPLRDEREDLELARGEVGRVRARAAAGRAASCGRRARAACARRSRRPAGRRAPGARSSARRSSSRRRRRRAARAPPRRGSPARASARRPRPVARHLEAVRSSPTLGTGSRRRRASASSRARPAHDASSAARGRRRARSRRSRPRCAPRATPPPPGRGDGRDPLQLLARLRERARLVERRPRVGVAAARAHEPERDERVDPRERALLAEADRRGLGRLGPAPVGELDLRLPAEQVVAPDVVVARAAVVEPVACIWRLRSRTHAAGTRCAPRSRTSAPRRPRSPLLSQLDRLRSSFSKPPGAPVEELHPADDLQGQDGSRGSSSCSARSRARFAHVDRRGRVLRRELQRRHHQWASTSSGPGEPSSRSSALWAVVKRLGQAAGLPAQLRQKGQRRRLGCGGPPAPRSSASACSCAATASSNSTVRNSSIARPLNSAARASSGSSSAKPQRLPVVDRGLAVGAEPRRLGGRGRRELQHRLRVACRLGVMGEPGGVGRALGRRRQRRRAPRGGGRACAAAGSTPRRRAAPAHGENATRARPRDHDARRRGTPRGTARRRSRARRAATARPGGPPRRPRRAASRAAGLSRAARPSTASRTVAGISSSPAASASVTKNGLPPVLR